MKSNRRRCPITRTVSSRIAWQPPKGIPVSLIDFDVLDMLPLDFDGEKDENDEDERGKKRQKREKKKEERRKRKEKGKKKGKRALVDNIDDFACDTKFIRRPTVFSLDKCKLQAIRWLTVSNTSATLNNACVRCKIQVTAKAHLLAINCVFIALNPAMADAEAAVDVFANSSAKFKKCAFYDKLTAVKAKNYSAVKFFDCDFYVHKIAVYVTDDSCAKINKCRFAPIDCSPIEKEKKKEDEAYRAICHAPDKSGVCVFVCKDSKAKILHSTFAGMPSMKCAWVNAGSYLTMIGCSIFDCRGTATIAEDSVAVVKKCRMLMKKETSLRAISGSLLIVDSCTVANYYGNCVNLDNADAVLVNSTFATQQSIGFAATGRFSNPVAHGCNFFYADCLDCQLEDALRALADNSYIKKEGGPIGLPRVVQAKNFAQPKFVNCHIGKSRHACVALYGAKLLLEKCTVDTATAAPLLACSGGRIYKDTDGAYCDANRMVLLNKGPVEKFNMEKTSIKSWRSPTYRVPTLSMVPVGDYSPFYDMRLVPMGGDEISGIVDSDDNGVPACCVCSQEKEDLLLASPCGHLVCAECASKLEGNCPLCDAPVKKTSKVYRQRDCLICLGDKKSTVVCQPCGHMCACYACFSSSCKGSNCKCPMCNEQIATYAVYIKS